MTSTDLPRIPETEEPAIAQEPAVASLPPTKTGKRLLLKRLLLTFASLALVWSLLEVTALFLTPDPSPFWLRDGIFFNSMPLVTGHSRFGVVPQGTEARLPKEKRPGEIRIAVFGESSIEGVPYDHWASPPTMLYDELHRNFPDKDFTVINMGRTGSVAANTWYHLLKIRDYQLDVVVFYLGANDESSMGGEPCWAGEYPLAHSVWRSFVSVSPLLRYLRIYLPQFVWANQKAPSDSSCRIMSFPVWADQLIELAKETAPVVLVTSPVTSAYTALEDPTNSRTVAESVSIPVYRDLLRCRLQPSCDPSAASSSQVGTTAATNESGLDGRVFLTWAFPLHVKAGVWREAAARHSVLFVDLLEAMAQRSPGGYVGLSPDQFSDEIHLSLRGYLYLARMWVEALRPQFSNEPPRVALFPTPEEAAPYGFAVRSSPYSMLLNYVRRGWLITVIGGFEIVADYQLGGVRRPLAELIMGWARQQVGLPHGLPADLAPLLPGFDPTTLDPEADREHVDDEWVWQKMKEHAGTP